MSPVQLSQQAGKSGTGNHANRKANPLISIHPSPSHPHDLIKQLILGRAFFLIMFLVLKDGILGFSNFSRTSFFWITFFADFCTALLHGMYSYSYLNVLPACLGSSKINMTCPNSCPASSFRDMAGCHKVRVKIKGRFILRRENSDCQLYFVSHSMRPRDSEEEGTRRFGDALHRLMVWGNKAGCQQREGNHLLLRFMTRAQCSLLENY